MNFTSIRLDRLFDEIDHPVSLQDAVLLTPSVVHGVVPQSSLGMRPQQALREGYMGNLAQPDDFIISMSSHSHGIEYCGLHGAISPDYTLLRPKCDKKIVPYLKYALKSGSTVHQLGMFKTGIRMGLRLQWNKVRYCKIQVPDPNYALEIARFLDLETACIDALICKKERFIELLKEKRAAFIIECIRPKPEWSAYPFWSIAAPKSISGLTNEGLLSVYLDRGVIPYSEGGGLVHKPSDSLEKYQLVEPGDLVMNNQQAWRGSLGVSEYRGIVSPAYRIFELDRTKLNPTFANYMFRARPYVEKFMLASLSVGDIQRQIKWPHLRIIPVSLPSLNEQNDLVEQLEAEGSRIARLISQTERSIELLKEKRAAIITAAVTGKIDVRTAA